MKETKPTENVENARIVRIVRIVRNAQNAQNALIENEAVDFATDFVNGHAALLLLLSRYQRILKC